MTHTQLNVIAEHIKYRILKFTPLDLNKNILKFQEMFNAFALEHFTLKQDLINWFYMRSYVKVKLYQTTNTKSLQNRAKIGKIMNTII